MKKYLSILALVAAICTAAAYYFDGNDATKPDVGAVIDAGKEVIHDFTTKAPTPAPEAETTTPAK